MKRYDIVKLTKVNIPENPLYQTPAFEDYEAGRDYKHNSVPLNYTVQGTLIDDIIPGNSILIHRTSRNGIIKEGIMKTSKVISIDGNKIQTLNSIYEIEVLDSF